ncbi:MAG: BsuBI/PstI family type II restriction endonuclease [Pseudomonadota bacterium]|nr:BsuBI/PstI family type II restriction endonuclease [Pseudomonadota bacterium]
MALEERIQKLRDDALAGGKKPVADVYQGVGKERIIEVLKAIDRHADDLVDAVFALLDNAHASWFTKAPAGIRFCDGASTAHIACHVGILQRGQRKLDREGRDYWLKPFWELGGMEKVYFDSRTRAFIPGHPVAKSPNSAYRLAGDFKAILTAPEKKWRAMLREWINEDKVRQRLDLQARLAELSRAQVDTKHSDLIQASCEYYAPHFLTGYEVLYIDEADGDRVSEPDRDNFYRAGIDIGLEDSMPDVLLWNPQTDHLWVIEAVTSDGEVDHHKVNNLTALARRCGKSGVGFTTTYQTWSVAARRQGKYKNIAPGTYIWIQEDPSKHYLAETFEIE